MWNKTKSGEKSWWKTDIMLLPLLSLSLSKKKKKKEEECYHWEQSLSKPAHCSKMKDVILSTLLSSPAENGFIYFFFLSLRN